MVKQWGISLKGGAEIYRLHTVAGGNSPKTTTKKHQKISKLPIYTHYGPFFSLSSFSSGVHYRGHQYAIITIEYFKIWYPLFIA